MASSASKKVDPPQTQDHQPGRETEMHSKPQYQPMPQSGLHRSQVPPAKVSFGQRRISRHSTSRAGL
jgi:hypothetical protein